MNHTEYWFQILKYDVKVLHPICQQIWKNQQWPQDYKRSVFNPVPKKGNAKEYSNYHTIVLISHASSVTLKILQARLQQYVNWEIPDVQAGFRKGRGTRDQIVNIYWIIEKAREFQKNIWSEVKVAQLCLILCDLMDYIVHGILQARILEWVAVPFSRGSSQPRDGTHVSHIAGGLVTSWDTREAHSYNSPGLFLFFSAMGLVFSVYYSLR